jgi:hypothetical protein
MNKKAVQFFTLASLFRPQPDPILELFKKNKTSEKEALAHYINSGSPMTDDEIAEFYKSRQKCITC